MIKFFRIVRNEFFRDFNQRGKFCVDYYKSHGFKEFCCMVQRKIVNKKQRIATFDEVLVELIKNDNFIEHETNLPEVKYVVAREENGIKSKQIKIIYLVHQFYPMHYTGTEKFVLNQARIQQKQGHKVKVITNSFENDSFYDQREGAYKYKNFCYQGIEIIAFKNKKEELSIYGDSDQSCQFEKKILMNEKPDIIHVGHPMGVVGFITAAQTLKVPYILTLTDFWLLCPRSILINSQKKLCWGPGKCEQCKVFCPDLNNDQLKIRYQEMSAILRQSSGNYSPSKFLAQIFKSQMPEFTFEVINHGFVMDNLVKSTKVYTADSALTFFYGGSFGPHKGVHVLISAFKVLKNTKAKLVIYGSGQGWYEANLKLQAQDNLNIEFRGVFKEEQISAIMKEVDVAIVPSLWFENYPLVLHEALACGVPIIASDIGGMKEKIKDGYNGFTFEVGNGRKLLELLQKIVNQPTILNEIQFNLKNFILPTIKQEAEQYSEIFRRIINK